MSYTIAEKDDALLGLRVFTAMHHHQLSIPKLAKAAHLPLSAVQKIVAGKGKQPSVWTIAALADALDTSVDFLIGRTEGRYP